MSPARVSAIGAFLREQREQARLSVVQLAQAAGLPSSYLAQLERGVRKPSADVLQQIARGLQASAGLLYDQGAIVAAVPDGPTGTGVRESVLADPGLTVRQRQMLLEVYESFRKETAQAAAAAEQDATTAPPQDAVSPPQGATAAPPQDATTTAPRTAANQRGGDEPPPNGPSPAGSG
jgi:transcriptional regulator with XRE-family HTH domain